MVHTFLKSGIRVFVGMFPLAAVCRLLVCHGGSLHVPEWLIWAGAWHGRWVGGWHGHGGPNSGLSKTHRFNPDYAHHFSLSLSAFSLHWPPSLPPSFPTHAFALFLSPAALSPAHASLFHRNLKADTQKPDAPHWLTCCLVITFSLCPWSVLNDHSE